jgi:hypothetical protein
VRTVITVLVIVLLVALWAAEHYFMFGPGRRLTVGRPDHWWNRPLTAGARRGIGVVGVVVGVAMVVLQLRGGTHPAQGYFGSAVLIVLGVLLATGVLPRRRRATGLAPDDRTDPTSDRTTGGPNSTI